MLAAEELPGVSEGDMSIEDSCPWRIDIVASFERNVTMLHWCKPLNGIFGRQCVQERQTCSIGGRHRGKSQEPLSLGRIGGENETSEADRQSHR